MSAHFSGALDGGSQRTIAKNAGSYLFVCCIVSEPLTLAKRSFRC